MRVVSEAFRGKAIWMFELLSENSIACLASLFIDIGKNE